jgi:hypothetical protein
MGREDKPFCSISAANNTA